MCLLLTGSLKPFTPSPWSALRQLWAVSVLPCGEWLEGAHALTDCVGAWRAAERHPDHCRVR